MPAKLFVKFKSFLFIILIILLGVVVYSNSLNGEFIWDDAGLVKNNLYIRNWSGVPGIFTKNIWAGIGEESVVYRPLQMLTYTLDYSVWKLDVFGYHLTNLILHILAALALYWFISVLLNRSLLAFFSSLMFICFPAHVEAVAYISGRADSLVTIFILISFIFYLKFLQRKSTFTWVIMTLSFILALLSRENALILPALLSLYHYAFKKKLELKSLAPFLVITVGYILFRLVFMTTIFYDIPAQSSLIQRLPGFLIALTNYIRILFLPFNLHMEYGNILFSFLNFKVIFGLIIISGLLFWGRRSKNSNPLICFSIFWFLIALLPVSNLYPINSYMAEHWLYLPSIGFFLILGELFERNYAKEKMKLITLGLFICLLSGYGYLTFKQNNYWGSELYFFKRTLKYAPQSSKVYYNLGNALYSAGDNLGGVGMYLKAIQLEPRCAGAYENIGSIYISLGRNEEGIKYCQKALEINPGLFSSYYNLGNAYYNLGQKDKAMEMIRQSIKLNPFYLEAYNNLAAGYVEKGKIKEAIDLWNQCLKIDPDFTAAHFNLAVFYFSNKDYALAIKHCDRVIALGGVVDKRFLEKLEPYRGRVSCKP